MEDSIRIELNSEFDSECDSVVLEVVSDKSTANAHLDEIDSLISDLDTSIDGLTNHGDKLDYSVAAASGIIAGIADILFVGEFDLQKGREWSEEKVNDFVKFIAKKTGYKGEDLPGSIKHLEKFGTPSDSVYNKWVVLYNII